MIIRRIVTGTDEAGKSVVLTDGPAPRSFEFSSAPGFAAALLWATEADDALSTDIIDRSTSASFVPGPAGSRLIVSTFPPESSMFSADFDALAYAKELAERVPGLAETFEPDCPGMHRTDSIDYDIVLDGEITLELDDGRELLMRKHDVAIQHGNRHAWHNRGDKPATLLFVLLGARRPSSSAQQDRPSSSCFGCAPS